MYFSQLLNDIEADNFTEDDVDKEYEEFLQLQAELAEIHADTVNIGKDTELQIQAISQTPVPQDNLAIKVFVFLLIRLRSKETNTSSYVFKCFYAILSCSVVSPRPSQDLLQCISLHFLHFIFSLNKAFWTIAYL